MNENYKRIDDLLRHTKKRANTLAKELGYSSATIFYQIKTGRNGISANLARNISELYPEINYNWLLTGEGEMLLNKKEAPKTDLLNRIEFLEDHIKGINARLKLLEQKRDAVLTTPNKETA